MKILHLRFSEIWPGKGKRYGRPDGRTYTEPRPIYVSRRGRHIITLRHKNHLGGDSTTKLPQNYLYWPKMEEDIHFNVLQCSSCNSTKSHNQKEPINPHPVPSLPWKIVASDLFNWNSIVYLILVDSYSEWFDFNTLKHMTSKLVITLLKRHFVARGTPQVLIANNTRQHTSHVFSSKLCWGSRETWKLIASPCWKIQCWRVVWFTYAEKYPKGWPV